MTSLDIRPADECRYDAVSLGEVMLRLDPGEERIKAGTPSTWCGRRPTGLVESTATLSTSPKEGSAFAEPSAYLIVHIARQGPWIPLMWTGIVFSDTTASGGSTRAAYLQASLSPRPK